MKTHDDIQQIVAEKDARIAEQDARIIELEALVKFYEEQFRLSQIRRFGSSSEKGNWPDQLGMFDEAENTADLTVPEPEFEEIIYKRRKTVGKRKDDLSGLPVVVVEHKLPEDELDCPNPGCDGKLHEMGHDERIELIIEPAKVSAAKHIRSVYSCRDCEKNSDTVPIVKAPVPEPVIKGSLASPSAVAHIMTQKYVMHAPLYRQEQDFLRQGVSLSRQTMANWVVRCSQDWLMPIYALLLALLIQRNVLHADETTVQVLDEPEKSPASKSYMWVYRTSGDTDRHIILFEYQPSRSHAHPMKFLTGFEGYLHADGYDGYHKLPPWIIVVGCWVHLRRYFKDALKVIPESEKANSHAQEALRQIGYLFHLENLWEDLEPDKRYELRLEKSKPLAEKFFAWLETLMVLPKSTMGKAVHYALAQRPWLMNFYLDGRTELSNNRIENSVRPFALGRKNWLFSATVNGAEASAAVFSIIETAMANDLKPFEYLKFLLETMPNTTTGKIEELLPWGSAVPDYCRMPKKQNGGQHANNYYVGNNDAVCSRVS